MCKLSHVGLRTRHMVVRCRASIDGCCWLLELPAHPSNARVKTWRRLQQLGAVPVKHAVYVLPNSMQALEDFEWLRSEIEGFLRTGDGVHRVVRRRGRRVRHRRGV